MLNELYILSKSISNIGIEQDNWHREYKPLPRVTFKAPCLRVWISINGIITGIDELTSDLAQKLRKFGDNNKSFPAFNIKPLYRITDIEQAEAFKKMTEDPSKGQLDVVKRWCIHNNWIKSLENIDNSIRTISGRLLDALKRHGGDDDTQIVMRLIQAVLALNGGFRAALETYILSTFEKAINRKTLLQILFHSGNVKKNASDDMGNNLSLIFDLDEWQSYGSYPVASEETTRLINSVLVCDNDVKGTFDDGKLRDAFGISYEMDSESEPMPEVKLPHLGTVKLRAMYKGQPCQKRYGNFDGASYPIARNSRAEVKRALEWISKEEHQGTMWTRADKDEIVFVYPSELPEIPLRFASMFSSVPGAESKKAEVRFEKIAEDFIRAFEGLTPKERPEYIRIFSVRKMDRARSKVVFTRNLTPEWYIEAALAWQKGCGNVPSIDFVDAAIPFPLDIARIVNTVWKQDGGGADGKTAVKCMQFYQGMELLLDDPVMPASKQAVRNYMRVLLRNAQDLASFAGHKSYKGKNITTANANVAEAVAVFGLLLYKCGYQKENYMKCAAYVVGQMLKASDELHALYCNVVRSGDIPPQLVGNSMFVIASEVPDKALAQLSLRVKPYISWAKQYRTKGIEKTGAESWRAGWYLKQLEASAGALRNNLSETVRFNDFDKAQMFLGYLAAFPKHEKSDIHDSSYEGEEQR
ncbi:MAG: hypothetical protein LBD42_04560 [Desulfovibrio sp.]|jgi:hypothetical protein|nr:hypothetical protein [Desulfovibrio sp.]